MHFVLVKTKWPLMVTACKNTSKIGHSVITNVQRFLTNFFRGVFGRAQHYLDWLCCVALPFVVCFVLRCLVLCCDVMLCVVNCLFSVFLFLCCTTRRNNWTDVQWFDQLDQLNDLISKTSTVYSPQANTVFSMEFS